MTSLGRHILLELKECDMDILDNKNFIEKTLLQAAEDCSCTILGHFFHKFSPQGVSGVVVIAESHFSIHTWPEKSYAAIDIFTCGEKVKPENAIPYLVRSFKSTNYSVIEVKRGSF